MEFIIAFICLFLWFAGCVSGIVLGGLIHLLLVAGIVLVLTRLVMLLPELRPEKKVKISFKVDTDSAAKAQQQIRDLQEALRFFVDRSDDVSEQLELERARNEMKDRHKAEIVDLFERYQRLAHWVQDDRDAAEAEVVRLKARVENLQRLWAETGKLCAKRVGELMTAHVEISDLKDQVEQMNVQMAGISVAALGWSKEPATRGMYGWSVPYQEVLDLRRKYDLARGRVTYIDNL